MKDLSCIVCKKVTRNIGGEVVLSKSGRKMFQTECEDCRSNKARPTKRLRKTVTVRREFVPIVRDLADFGDTPTTRQPSNSVVLFFTEGGFREELREFDPFAPPLQSVSPPPHYRLGGTGYTP